MKGRTAVLLAGALLLSQAGCGELRFDQSDHDQTREVFLDTTFQVSLPMSTLYRRPRMKGTIIRSLGERRDESSGTDVFDFEAEGLGEDELRISRPSGQDFVLHIRVKSASDQPTVSVHQP